MPGQKSIREYFEGNSPGFDGGWGDIADPAEANDPYGHGEYTAVIPGDRATTRDPFHDADMARRAAELAATHNSEPPEQLGRVVLEANIVGDRTRPESVARSHERISSAEYRRAAGLPDIGK